MNAISLGLVWIVAQTAPGWDGHSRQNSQSCDRCGVSGSVVVDEIIQLQNAPAWRTRERAANALRRVNWRCHPDVIGALSYSLLHDPHEEVREEAAESLAKLAKEGACEPVLHEALAVSAQSERDFATRLNARRGLRNLSKHCRGKCQIREPTGSEIVVSAPTVIAPSKLDPISDTPVILEPVDPLPSVTVPPPPSPGLGSSTRPQGPTIDSRVNPSATEPGLDPLPAPAEELKPLPDPQVNTRRESARPVARSVPSRPRLVILNQGLFRPW